MIARPVVLAVLDGWGVREDPKANAIAMARTPTFHELLRRYPNTTLEASGEAVGLPAGQMGNSEVGHMNMGAGRVVYQDLTRIDKALREGELLQNRVLRDTMERCATGTHALHFMGLLSDGGVHSHQRHLYGLIDMAARLAVPRVFVHAFTDGRDTSPTAGVRYVAELERVMDDARVGRLATVGGRYYAMDRDKRWERSRRAYDAITLGEGHRTTSPRAYLQQSYETGVTDEFVEPAVVVTAEGQPVATIEDGDSVIFFNFRADRARQLTWALTLADFDGFERRARPRTTFVCMTEYDARLTLPIVFTPQTFAGSLADVLAARAVNNLRLAETEKYAHVTYFFNCGEERPYPGEDRILIPSPKVATYDLQPAMSAREIATTLVADIEQGRHQVVICNFANADMVGHTGKIDAAIAAVETLDDCLARIVAAIRACEGTLLVTADHGNCEQMWDDALNSPHTAHTSNPVPFILVKDGERGPLRAGGALCDVAPTMLGLLGLSQSPEMTGEDLRNA